MQQATTKEIPLSDSQKRTIERVSSVLFKTLAEKTLDQTNNLSWVCNETTMHKTGSSVFVEFKVERSGSEVTLATRYQLIIGSKGGVTMTVRSWANRKGTTYNGSTKVLEAIATM